MLTEAEIGQFVSEGVVRIPGAVDPDWCEAQVQQGFVRLGVREDEPESWDIHRVHMPATQGFPLMDHAPLAWEALCQLLGGAERIRQPASFADNFIMVFRGEDRPWLAPAEERGGWHVDGDWFLHFMDSPEQAILGIILWRDLAPRQGGTCYATDSIGPVARRLRARPEGVEPNGLDFEEIRGECQGIRELSGKAGDFLWMHPFILHTGATNTRARPRVLGNSVCSLLEPMSFDRADGAYSPVERAVLEALGEERIPFRATGQRARITPQREEDWRRQKREEAERARGGG